MEVKAQVSTSFCPKDVLRLRGCPSRCEDWGLKSNSVWVCNEAARCLVPAAEAVTAAGDGYDYPKARKGWGGVLLVQPGEVWKFGKRGMILEDSMDS